MGTKTKTTASTIDVSPLYNDFEPLCEWKRGEDLLIVHVPDFKKEHLTVLVNTSGALKISGERPLGGEKAGMKSRFYKETRVPEGCNIGNVKARLCEGKLTIAMPRNYVNTYLLGVQPSTQGRGLDEKEEEIIGFGRLKVSKKMAVNVGVAVAAIAAIGALVIFKPETDPPSPSFANIEE